MSKLPKRSGEAVIAALKRGGFQACHGLPIRATLLMLFLLLGPAMAGPPQEPGTPEVFIVGTALESMVGPCVLQSSGVVVFIDGLAFWPPGFYEGGRDGKRVVCRGRLVERYDLPVFEDKPDAPKREGIPVPPGTDMHEASRRYLLTSAEWDEWRISTDPFRGLKPVIVAGSEDSGADLAPQPNCMVVLQVPSKIHMKRLKGLVKGLNDKGFPTVKVEFLADKAPTS